MTEKYYDKIYSSNAKRLSQCYRSWCTNQLTSSEKKKNKKEKLFNNRFGITNDSSVSAHDSMAEVRFKTSIFLTLTLDLFEQ